MVSKLEYLRQTQRFEKGVRHATLDPEGPGWIRLHLVPPRPNKDYNPPSLLMINGYFQLAIGPAWADILGMFIDELNEHCPIDREISEKEFSEIEAATVKRVRSVFKGLPKKTIIVDLHKIVLMAMRIAQGGRLPKSLIEGDSYNVYKQNASGPARIDLIIAPMLESGKRRCQLDCSCCYANCQPMMEVESQLSTQSWKKIIDNCKAASIPMITFTGGEPTTRSDLVELVEYSKWFVTRLNTNGYALTADLAKQLKKASLDGIQITFYSRDPKIHDKLVGKEGAWEKTLAGIKNAVAAGLNVSVNTPLMGLNNDYPGTISFLHELGVRYFTCSGLITTGNAANIAEGETLTKDSLKTILSESMKVADELHVETGFTSPGKLSDEELQEIGFPISPKCGVCIDNMAVAPNGAVIPCQSWLNGLTFGNMLHDGWKEIWKKAKLSGIPDQYAGKNHCSLT